MQVDDTPVHVAFTMLPDLASELVGGSVCSCNDDFFAEAGCLVRASIPAFDPDAYDDNGKVMDGWESQRGRRRNRPGGEACDVAIVALGIPGEIVGVDVNTAHFLGNAPRTVELHAAEVADGADPSAEDVAWTPLAARCQVAPGTRNLVPVEPTARARRFTHVRLTIHPDGGVARLRVHGTGRPTPDELEGEVNLAAARLGAVTVAASDQFFGGISNLLLPGDSNRMDEGWETKRTRDRSFDDWVVVRLAAPGRVTRATIDTSWFKGNAPDTVRLEGVLLGDRADLVDPAVDDLPWRELVPTSDVDPHERHEFDAIDAGVVDHVRLVIEPDGGIARLRVWGTVEQ